MSAWLQSEKTSWIFFIFVCDSRKKYFFSTKVFVYRILSNLRDKKDVELAKVDSALIIQVLMQHSHKLSRNLWKNLRLCAVFNGRRWLIHILYSSITLFLFFLILRVIGYSWQTAIYLWAGCHNLINLSNNYKWKALTQNSVYGLAVVLIQNFQSPYFKWELKWPQNHLR